MHVTAEAHSTWGPLSEACKKFFKQFFCSLSCEGSVSASYVLLLLLLASDFLLTNKEINTAGLCRPCIPASDKYLTSP